MTEDESHWKSLSSPCPKKASSREFFIRNSSLKTKLNPDFYIRVLRVFQGGCYERIPKQIVHSGLVFASCNVAAYMVLTVLHFLSENSMVWVTPPPLLP